MATVDVFGWKRRKKQKLETAEAVETKKEVTEPVKKTKAKAPKKDDK